MNCECGNKMVLKLARKGETKGNFFWGCSNYPYCQFTKEYVIPKNRFDFANNDFMPIIRSLNEKSKSEQETIETEITVQMIQILEHFIGCTWGAHFNTMFDELIKPYLRDSVTLDYVLRGDSVKETKGNVIRGNTGAKIYPELYEYLITVNSSDIINYLETEFKNYLQHNL